MVYAGMMVVLRFIQPRHVDAVEDRAADPDRDPVLCAPWTHAGTVETAVVLKAVIAG